MLRPSGSLYLLLSSKSLGSPVAEEVQVSLTVELFPKRIPLCHTCLLLTGDSHTVATFINFEAGVSIINDELAQQLTTFGHVSIAPTATLVIIF